MAVVADETGMGVRSAGIVGVADEETGVLDAAKMGVGWNVCTGIVVGVADEMDVLDAAVLGVESGVCV